MKWFDGTIPVAIQQAKQQRSIFIVYIRGQDDSSKQMDVTWENEAVTQLCQQNDCVALQMEANSDNTAQFGMIYPVVCVPCTFFIGENGVPLEVTGGFLEPDAFVEKINDVIKMYRAQLSGQKVEPLNQSPESHQGAAAASPLSVPETSSEQPSSATSPEEEAMITDDRTNQASTSAQSTAPLEDRVKRAKDLVEDKRKEKQQQDVDKEKDAELEKRKLGKDMNKLKNSKDDRQRQETLKEWKREKEETKREKDRIREQIARDREEKTLKFQAQKEQHEAVVSEAKRAKLEKDAEKTAETEAVRMQHARIQFRLPDGSSVTQQFPSSDTLQSAYNFLRNHLGTRFGRFCFTTHYPKRDFTEEHMSQTLLDLGLAPSAIIIVIPGSLSATASVSRPDSSNNQSYLWLMLTPLLSMWHFIYDFVFGAPAQPSPSADSQGAAQSQPSTSQPPSEGTRQQRPKSSYGLRSRQEGNMHSLRANEEDDEDKRTWNGNSTQQM